MVFVGAIAEAKADDQRPRLALSGAKFPPKPRACQSVGSR